MTINKFIYDFKELTDKHGLSQDSGWNNRHIYNFLLKYRAKLLREKILKNMPISKFNYQTISGIELVKDSAGILCPTEDCKIKKSKYALPTTILDFKSVNSSDGFTTYPYVDFDKIIYKQNSRFKSVASDSYYTLINNDSSGVLLCLVNDPNKESLSATGVFYDPLEAYRFTTCDETHNKTVAELASESFYMPIDPDYVSTVYSLAISELLRFKSTNSDTINQSLDDIISNQNVNK